jgi:hypothetical protein
MGAFDEGVKAEKSEDEIERDDRLRKELQKTMEVVLEARAFVESLRTYGFVADEPLNKVHLCDYSRPEPTPAKDAGDEPAEVSRPEGYGVR